MGQVVQLHAPLAPIASPVALPDGKVRILCRVYMGRSIPEAAVHDARNAVVRDSSVNAFIERVVSVLFPEGFTVTHAEGGWQDKDGVTVKEPAVIVEVVTDKDGIDDVLALAREWKRWFSQESVMVTASPVLAQFV